jgi:hypothetical protein
MCLEHGADRCAETPRFLDVLVHEVGVRINDRELAVGETAQ